jgi:hypothetical protein
MPRQGGVLSLNIVPRFVPPASSHVFEAAPRCYFAAVINVKEASQKPLGLLAKPLHLPQKPQSTPHSAPLTSLQAR